MGKKNQFQDELNVRWSILVIVKQVAKSANYFFNPPSKLESNFINRRIELTFVRWAIWRLLIIEISKLVSSSESQKFNVNKLINKLKPGGFYSNLEFDANMLEDYQKRLELHKGLIEEIEKFRNKVYAHNDESPFLNLEPNFSIDDCIDLIFLIEEFIAYLGSKILNTSFICPSLTLTENSFDYIYEYALSEQQHNIQLAESNGFSYKEFTGCDIFLEERKWG
ncbi:MULTISPECIES: hypothetical protein [unclassified Sphingobacterium]|uniref:AbiU2 domain-containing protein n=1 Tax=unclassified Sphingobacterium TaxID=2609468 RepID=UPI0025DA9905|nr:MULTISPECIES: hypothetical protein [unclassified Sphingobacterium]